MSDSAKIGVWRAIGRLSNYRVGELLWPEGLFAMAIGVGVGVAIAHGTKVADRADIVGDVLTLSGALLAVVFTALALVVSIPSDNYVREMSRTRDGGIMNFLDPFLIAVGTQVATLLLGFGYKLSAEHVPWKVEHGSFYVLSFLVVFGLLDVAGLARQLVRHGVNRSLESTSSGNQDGGKIQHINDGRRDEL